MTVGSPVVRSPPPFSISQNLETVPGFLDAVLFPLAASNDSLAGFRTLLAAVPEIVPSYGRAVLGSCGLL